MSEHGIHGIHPCHGQHVVEKEAKDPDAGIRRRGKNNNSAQIEIG